MKKIGNKTHVYRCIEPYRNWYSIMTDDWINASNIIMVGRRQVIKVIYALIKVVLFGKCITIVRYKK